MESLSLPKSAKEITPLEVMRDIGRRAMGVLLVVGAGLSVSGCVLDVFGEESDVVDYPVRGEMPAQMIDPPYEFVFRGDSEVEVPETPWIPPAPEPYVPLELALEVTGV